MNILTLAEQLSKNVVGLASTNPSGLANEWKMKFFPDQAIHLRLPDPHRHCSHRRFYSDSNCFGGSGKETQ